MLQQKVSLHVRFQGEVYLNMRFQGYAYTCDNIFTCAILWSVLLWRYQGEIYHCNFRESLHLRL